MALPHELSIRILKFKYIIPVIRVGLSNGVNEEDAC
jgi:hypothetical protein